MIYKFHTFFFNFAHLYRLFAFFLQTAHTKKDDYLLPNKQEFLFLTNIYLYFNLLYALNYQLLSHVITYKGRYSRFFFKEGISEAAYFSLMQHSHSAIKTYLITMFSTNANVVQLKFQSMLQIKLFNPARYHVRTGSPRYLEKIGHLHVNDYGENDFRFQLKSKILQLIVKS